MNTYRCWYSTGGCVLVVAENATEAKVEAERIADKDGYPGVSVTKVEKL